MAAIPTAQLLLVLAGFPLLYVLNSVTPWFRALEVQQNAAFFVPVVGSVIALHWSVTAVAVVSVRGAGGSLADVGFRIGLRGLFVMIAVLAGVGLALILLRPALVAPGSTSVMTTLPRQLVWVLAAISAGFCEELVFRGFAIRALQGRGLGTGTAVVVATTSFVLVHGVAGLDVFPVYFVVGLWFALLFLVSDTLLPGIVIHALFDLRALVW